MAKHKISKQPLVVLPVVGVDPSLTGTAVWSSSGYSKEFSSRKAEGIKGRLNRYDKLIQGVLDAIQFEPEVIAIEGYLAQIKGHGIGLVEYGWQLRVELMRKWPKAKLIEISPSLLKKFASGKGNADKVAVASGLTKRYGVVFTSDNMADAFGLMRIALMMAQREDPENNAQGQVWQKLEPQMG